VHVVEVKKRMGEEDIAAVARLLRAAERVDGHAPLGEHKWLDLVHGGRPGFAGFVAREPGHERLVGYAQLARGNENWSIEFVLHPSVRELDNSVGITLLSSVMDEIANDGGGHVHLWVPKPTPRHDEIADAVGLTRGRELFQMRRTLPLEDTLLVAGKIDVRPFRVGLDEAGWVALNQRAFEDHPEQGGWELQTLLDRENQLWFDASGFLLHESDGDLDAFCWTKIHDEGDELVGEIYVIGVDPSRRGHGLGTAMLRAGLELLSDRKIGVAMLYVDADNLPALAMYRAFGFAVDHVDMAYVGNVKPASRQEPGRA
jgi:mycothiol synthase